MKFRIPKYVRKFLLKMGILMLIFTLCRLLFYANNAAFFPEASAYDFIVGFWFDLVTASLLLLPLIVVELFPNPNRKSKWFKWLVFSLTFLTFLFGIGLNLIDVEYFSYTTTRASSSLFVMLGFGDDLSSQLPSFLANYWLLLLLLTGLLVGSFWLFKRANKKEDDSPSVPIWTQGLIYIFFLGLAVFFGRGGFVSKPIRPTEASKFTDPSNAQLVLNSAFTVITSWGIEPLQEKNYMSSDEASALFTPIRHYTDEGPLKGQNVVVIILESFAIEYISSLNLDDESYAPFFDQLVDSSLVYDYAFANGKKSIDAVPSILASVPKMMHDEYLLTSYATNEVESLPELLGSMGYETGFFHGATNGSMNFDAFCSHIGFDNYYGRSEYDNETDFDGTWGIYDDKFMSWCVNRFSEMKQPFFSTLFTISSHPPYSIPDKYAEEFSDIKSDVHRSVRYTDKALELFFSQAAQTDWYENTLFVLTADHTSSSNRDVYVHDRGKMHIPLIFYHPTDTNFRGRDGRIMGHIDIMPTVLDLLGYDQPFFSFGHSAYDTIPGYTFSQIADKNYLFEYDGVNPHLLIFEGDKTVAMYHFLDRYQTQNMITDKPDVVEHMERRLKAIIQVHNNALIENKMTAEKSK